MDYEERDKLASLYAAAADIQRWAMQMAQSQKLSSDRLNDIDNAAERIIELSGKLA